MRYRLCGTEIQEYDEELGPFPGRTYQHIRQRKEAIATAYRGVVSSGKPYYSIKEYPL